MNYECPECGEDLEAVGTESSIEYTCHSCGFFESVEDGE